MATLTIRNLPEAVHFALKARAKQHGRSLAAEVRAILEHAVNSGGIPHADDAIGLSARAVSDKRPC